MFRFFPEGIRIPFMSIRLPTAVVSSFLILASLYLIATKGLNFGVDFAGGIQMVLKFSDQTEIGEDEIRTKLGDLGLEGSSVQRFGTEFEEAEQEFIIHFSGDFTKEEQKLLLLERAFSDLTESGETMVTQFRFSGLEKAYFRLKKDLEFSEVQERVSKIDYGLMQFEGVAPFGSGESREYELRFKSISNRILGEFQSDFGEEQVSLQKVDFVGAKVGSDLKTAAILSILVTILLVFVYIFLRFDLAYAPGVIVALAHDVLITTGIFSLLGIEFDLTVVAALLTVAGYSINDTIVVYDRIREVAVEFRGKNLKDILDIAISQTLNRTIVTSLTTLMATGLLWVFGGPVIHSFAFALSIGVLVGTYSSIFVASSLVYWVDGWMKNRHSDKRPRKAA